MLVVVSISRRRFKSMVKPKWCKKSAPMIGLDTLATTNGHVNGRRRPKFNVMRLCPYDGMRVPFAANRLALSSFDDWVVDVMDAGSKDKSAPVSNRNCCLVVWSVMNRRYDAGAFWPVTCASMFAAGVSFLDAGIHRCISVLPFQTWHDNSSDHFSVIRSDDLDESWLWDGVDERWLWEWLRARVFEVRDDMYIANASVSFSMVASKRFMRSDDCSLSLTIVIVSFNWMKDWFRSS